MSTEENKASMRRAVEEGWNQDSLGLFQQLGVIPGPGQPG
jgi:hypothetical protein